MREREREMGNLQGMSTVSQRTRQPRVQISILLASQVVSPLIILGARKALGVTGLC